MKNKELLRQVLGSETNLKSVQAGAILDVLEKAESLEERKELLSIALIERDTVKKQPIALENKDILKEKWDELNTTHLDIVQGHLKMAFLKTNNAIDFAGEVIRLIDFLDGRDEKIFALASTLFSRYVPYKELPGTPERIPQHKSEHLLEGNKEVTEMIKYVVGLPFTVIESSSLILQILDSVKNNELRISLLAFYVSVIIANERGE